MRRYISNAQVSTSEKKIEVIVCRQICPKDPDINGTELFRSGGNVADSNTHKYGLSKISGIFKISRYTYDKKSKNPKGCSELPVRLFVGSKYLGRKYFLVKFRISEMVAMGVSHSQ